MQLELSKTVDRLAIIKQQIADLKKEEDALKADLINSGVKSIDGLYWSASVSEVEGRKTTDWRSIASKFDPSRQLIAAYTTQGEDFYQVRVFARKTS